MLGRFGDVEAQFVVKCALVKIPVILLGVRDGNSFCVKSGKGIDDELVGWGRLSNLIGELGIKHVDLKIWKEDLFRVVR